MNETKRYGVLYHFIKKDYHKVELCIVEISEQGKISNAVGDPVYNLVISAQSDTKKIGTDDHSLYGQQVAYHQEYCTTLQRAQEMVKVLRKAYGRSGNGFRSGSICDFAVFVQRVCFRLGIHDLVFIKTNRYTGLYSDNTFELVGIDDMISRLVVQISNDLGVKTISKDCKEIL